jgi:hypothetical protein
VLFFIHLESRCACLAGINAASGRGLDAASGAQRDGRKLGKPRAQAIRAARSGHEVLRFVSSDAKIGRNQTDPVAGNAFAERWVRSAKQECLSKLILFGEASLRRALNEPNEITKGKGNVLLFPTPRQTCSPSTVALLDR